MMHPRPTSPRAGEAGSTLVETLVAMGLLAVCVTSVAGLLAHATALLERAVGSAESAVLAGSVADALQRLPVGHPWLAPEGGEPGLAAAGWRVTWQAAPAPSRPDLLRIHVTVQGENEAGPAPAQVVAARGAL